MVSISQMKAFVLVSDRQSFTLAARELGLSSAAISKQLILLEKELGLQLMTRSTRSLELTQIGKSYYDQCKRVLEEIDIAASLVEQMKTTPQGSLKVVSGVSPPFFWTQICFNLIFSKIDHCQPTQFPLHQ
jgi:DNA-binding transcriptional LysR family regulator